MVNDPKSVSKMAATLKKREETALSYTQRKSKNAGFCQLGSEAGIHRRRRLEGVLERAPVSRFTGEAK